MLYVLRLIIFLIILSMPSVASAAILGLDEGVRAGYFYKFDCVGPNIECTFDAGTLTVTESGGGSGTTDDDITVNSAAVDTTGNWLDNLYYEWTLTDGGAGGPDDITVKPDFSMSLAGDPALLVDECFWGKDTSGGFIICEGSTADTSEQLYRFPDVNTESTNYFAMGASDGDALAGDSATGFFDAGTIEDARLPSGLTRDSEIDTYSELNTIVADQTLTHNGLIDTFAEIDAIVADKALVKLEDAQTFTGTKTFPGLILTAEAFIDALGLEFEAGDALTDCTTFSATGGGIFYDDSEGKFKKCQDNTLTDLDTGGAEVNNLESDGAADIADTEIFIGTGAGTGAYAALSGEATMANTGAVTLADSVTVTGWTLGTFSGTQGTIGALIANSLDTTGAADIDIGSADVTDVTFVTDGGTVVIDGSITQDAGTTLFMGGLLDATGAVDMDYGSADITDHTFVSDGGTAIIDGTITAGGAENYIQFTAGYTADPCTGAGSSEVPINSIFHNTTANELCWCNASGVDLRMSDFSTACF